MPDSTTTPAAAAPSDFIRTAVAEDLRSGRFDHIATRFPPEPNGYLHIGHAKAIAIDFGRQGAQGHAHVQAVRGPLIDAALVRTGALMTAHRST